MINTEPWIDFLLEHDTNHKYSKTNKEDVYKMVNIIAYILGNMIGSVHARYTEECNVPEDKRPIINMKNEFLMKRIMTTSNKKNYADYLWLQEGVEVPDEDSLDIKGLSIKKANVNNTVSKLLQENLENNILRSDDVNINTVLSSLIDLEKDIRTSLANGEVKYLVPDKSNEPSTYKTPFQVQAVRGIYVWNYLYPEKEITYPAQINKVKLNIDTIFKLDLDKMREDVGVEEADRIYNILEEKVFNDENMSKYGVTILCLPKSEKNIPKWAIPYIDVDTIVADSLSNFNKILESIGVKTISFTADDAHYSNIIDF